MDHQDTLYRITRLEKELHRLRTKYSAPNMAKYASDMKAIETAIVERIDSIKRSLEDEESYAYFNRFIAGDR